MILLAIILAQLAYPTHMPPTAREHSRMAVANVIPVFASNAGAVSALSGVPVRPTELRADRGVGLLRWAGARVSDADSGAEMNQVKRS